MWAALRANRTVRVQQSIQEFRDVRAVMWDRRTQMVNLARHIHGQGDLRFDSIAGSPLLALPGIGEISPVPLDSLDIWLDPGASPVEPVASKKALAILPYRMNGQRFTRYSLALQELAPPTLFFDGSTYEVVSWGLDDSGAPSLSFRIGSYFRSLDSQEAVVHELAANLGKYRGESRVPRLRDLPLRRELVEATLAGSRESLSLAVNCISLIERSDGCWEFILNKRDPVSTATFAGHFMVGPIGVFQPSSQSIGSVRDDFSLWRTVIREYCEEILGYDEADSRTGAHIDYEEDPPFRHLSAAIASGALDAFVLGIGLDPCELSIQLLVALVIHESSAPGLLEGLVTSNPEGILVGHRQSEQGIRLVPLEEHHLSLYVNEKSLSPASEACLRLAWKNRASLLNPLSL